LFEHDLFEKPAPTFPDHAHVCQQHQYREAAGNAIAPLAGAIFWTFAAMQNAAFERRAS
jgi:hypothetical protein